MVQLFNETFSFVDNEGGNVTRALHTLSTQLTTLQTHLTSTATQFDTGCDQITKEYSTFASRLDCQQIQTAFDVDALAEDISSATHSVLDATSSIQAALASARNTVHQVERQVFDATGSAQGSVQTLSNSVFGQGASY